jgi:chromosome segregation ATPase
MVSLEQIRALEARVEKAVVLIDKLRRENAELEQRLIEASRSDEQVKLAYSELERKTAISIRMASESEARVDALGVRLKEADDKTKAAELKAAEAEEKAAVLERKTLAAEAENAAYRDRALAAEQKSADLESKAEELKREQSRIEEGLTHALQKLDAFEDLVMGISVGNAGANAEGVANVNTEGVNKVSVNEAADTGDEKVEAVELSPATLAPQASPFPGASSQRAEHELDIF